MPFENATQEFSGGTYIILSLMISTIKELIFDLACDSSSNNINYLNEDTVFEIEDEFSIEIEDKEIISNLSKANTTGVFERVKNNIYSALIYYWNFFNDIELIAMLLDSHYKALDFVESEDEKKELFKSCMMNLIQTIYY